MTAARSETITLDGIDFTVPRLNIDQLERVSEAFVTLSPTKVPFAVLRIALERALPTADFTTLAPDLVTEIQPSVLKVLAMSGLQKPDENPQAPAPEAVPVPLTH